MTVTAPPARTTAPFGRRAVPIVEYIVYGAYTVLQCVDRAGPRPQAGQFYMLAAAERWGGGDGERPFLPRAFSVMRASPHWRPHPALGRTDRSSPSDCETGPIGPAATTGGHPVHLQFLLEDVGPGTHRLSELRAGDRLQIVGPLGVGFARPSDGRRPLLVGGGVGIAPIAIWQDTLGADVPVLLGFRDAARARGAVLLNRPRVATDDGSVGRHGLVTELLAEELDTDAHATVYACGPPMMLEAIRAICAERGVPAQLALESGMACGYGACFGCVVPTKNGLIRLCVEGPVLQAADLETALTPGAGH